MGNKGSVAKVTADKASSIAKTGAERIIKKNEAIGAAIPVINPAHDPSTKNLQDSGIISEVEPNDSESSAREKNANSAGFDPAMLREISKWSVKPKLSTTSPNPKDLHSSFDTKSTAAYLRDIEAQQYYLEIKRGQSIPGRLVGKEISSFFEDCRNLSNENDNVIGLSELAIRYQLDLKHAETLVKWNWIPLMIKDKHGKLIVKPTKTSIDSEK